jgi:hypothetical protein
MIENICQSGIDTISPLKIDLKICFFCVPGEEHLVRHIVGNDDVIDLRKLHDLEFEDLEKIHKEIKDTDRWILLNSETEIPSVLKINFRNTRQENLKYVLLRKIWKITEREDKKVCIITHTNKVQINIKGVPYVSELFYNRKQEFLDIDRVYGKEILTAEDGVEYPIDRKMTVKIVRKD